MIIAEKPGRRRNSTSIVEQSLGSPAGTGRGAGSARNPSPMRAVSGTLTRAEYSSSFRDSAAPGASARDRVLSKGLSDRVRKSDEGGRKSPGGTKDAGAAAAAAQSPKSPAHTPKASAAIGNRLSSSEKFKPKSLLSSVDVSSSFRQTAKAGSGSYNARGVSPLTHTLAGLMGRGRAPGVNNEQEAQLGDLVVGFGSSTFQGLRDYQEDTIAFLPGVSCVAGAVYDGHGGDQISKELERVLLHNIMRNVSDLSAKDQDTPSSIQAAISQTYVATNREISLRMHSSAEAGSCAVTFLITRTAGGLHLFCANAGDCRAVLYTGPAGSKRAVRLSEDHKPHPQVCPSEIRRVTSAGGCVLWGRVQGCLAVSRAFGDKSLQPYVIADPYVSVRPLNLEQDSFLYLVSDGVTDTVDDNTGCQVISEQLARGQSTAQAAAALVSAAYQKGSADNISVAVIRLRKH